MMQENSLHLENVCVYAGHQTLLQDVTVQIPTGKITVIVGASGAGKSVLLRVLAGLIPRAGEDIRWTGRIVWTTGNTIGHDSASHETVAGHNVPQRSPTVGVVFQDYALFDELDPIGNVQFAISHRPDSSARSDLTSAKDWLDRLGVPAEIPTSVLSGGQKQRLAIARTLAGNPDLVLYDEPTSGLDSATGHEVARLIEKTHSQFGRTSVIVTHDYETLLEIADTMLLFDAEKQTLRPVDPRSRPSIEKSIVPVKRVSASEPPATWPVKLMRAFNRFFETSGRVVVTFVRLPLALFPWIGRPERLAAGRGLRVPRLGWLGRFLVHYLRLVGGLSACVYLVIAGLIVGFTTTYFTFRFLPFRGYTQPLLIDELIASIGFALYRVLVPILATVLVAARCGAAVAADVGVKRYNGTIDAMQTFGVPARIYLLIPIVMAFLIATPILQWMAFQSARMIASVTFLSTHEDLPLAFWMQHFDRHLLDGTTFFREGWKWVGLKGSLSGLASGVIGYYRGNAPKGSASDVSQAITSTVLWSTLCVLFIHFVVALFEF